MFYALMLSGRLKNKKVVVPSVGWVTSIAPAIQFGFEPLMCEADPDTFGLDLNHLEEILARDRPGTVLLVQVLGVPHKNEEALLKLKERYGFVLLEGVPCAAFGSKLGPRNVGNGWRHGKFFLLLRPPDVDDRGRDGLDERQIVCRPSVDASLARVEPRSRSLDACGIGGIVRSDDFHTPFVFYEPGFNLRSTDLNAFIGLGQLQKLDRMAARRHANHCRYLNLLADRFYVQRMPAESQVSSISFGLLADDREHRRVIVKALAERGVETRLFSAGNLGLHPFWIKRYGKTSFPMADRIRHSGSFLPNHPALTDDDVARIAQIVREAA